MKKHPMRDAGTGKAPAPPKGCQAVGMALRHVAVAPAPKSGGVAPLRRIVRASTRKAGPR